MTTNGNGSNGSGELSKDARFNYTSIKSTKVSTGKKGELRVELSFTQAAVPALLEAIAALQGNERGVKLDMHLYESKTQDGSREFISPIVFVKAIQAFGSAQGAPNKFANKFPGKSAAAPAVTASAVAAARESVTKRLG